MLDLQKAAADEKELAQFGYKQELSRRMGGFANFALSFSVISILTGAVAFYGYGLQNGGPIEMLVGWPLVTGMTLLVTLSLAELSSAYPTAGALYHWATILGGKNIGWLTAWLNLIGQITVVAAVDWMFSEFVCVGLGMPKDKLHVLPIFAAVLISHGLLNHIGITVVTILNEVSAWYHLAGTALLIGVLLWMAPLKPASFLLERTPSDLLSHPFWYAFLIGLLQAQWTLTGYDASAHGAEETVDAHLAVPRGMVKSVWISGIAGYLALLAITLAIPDLHQATTADNSFQYILVTSLGRLGTVLFWIVTAAMWFCGLSAVTSNSRMLFAFARDGGPPGSRLWSAVSARFHTPTWAVWACVACSFLLAVYDYNVIASISTIGLYASYGIPVFLAIDASKRGRYKRGVWNLGRWSRPIAIGASIWVAFITVLFVLPPNQMAGYTFGGALAILAIYHLAWARKHFKGPQITFGPGGQPLPSIEN